MSSDAHIKVEVNVIPPYDRTKVLRLVDEAWACSCEIQEMSSAGVHGNIAKPINLLCIALQDLCLALKEINEPEELP